MLPIYALGDVHGQAGRLDDALSLIEADGGSQAQVVFVGDYVDRGPDSRGVIERLVSGIAEGRNWTCLKGNHDRLFERFLAKPEPQHDPHLLVGYHWLHEALGGRETIESYGLKVPVRIRQYDLAQQMDQAVPEAHKAFLKSLPVKHQVDNLFFVHAGVRPGVPLKSQTENDLLWIRQEFLEDYTDHGALVIHGHTPVRYPELYSNRLGIDTGAGYGRDLIPVVIDEDGVFAVTPRGRERLDVLT